MSQSVRSERSFSAGVNTGQLLGRKGRGRMERERMKGRMERSEMDTGGRSGTHPFLALFLPPVSSSSPYKPLLSHSAFPTVCLSKKSDALIQSTVLCVCGNQPDGSLWEGGRRYGDAKIPLLSSLTSCLFFFCLMYITLNVMVNDRIFWQELALAWNQFLLTDKLLRV